MKCPKCGHQNPDDTQVCQSCNFSLTNPKERQSKPKAKTSKTAILSLVLGIFSLFFFVFTGIPAIILGIISKLRIKNSGGRLKGKYIALTGMNVPIPLMCIFLIAWSFDTPPIPNDYTIADLRSAPADCATSYELLKNLTDPNNNLIEQSPDSNTVGKGIPATDVDIIVEISGAINKGNTEEISELLRNNADIIQQAWDKTKKAREVIHQLNEFPEIADLFEPSLIDDPFDEIALINLSRIYKAYICMQVEQGNDKDAVNELIKFDSVFRKLSINARDFLMKFLCFFILDSDFYVANFLINHPYISDESLQLLAQHFSPLTDRQVALRNTIIFHAILIQNATKTQYDKLDRRKQLRWKLNSTFRLYRNYWNNQLNIIGESQENEKPLSVWPSLYPDWLPHSIGADRRKVPWYYTLYNITGSIIFQVTTPSFNERYERKTRIKVKDDLLQIVLKKRLSEEVDLKARAYSDEYIIDIENKIIFSPGPDGEAGTRDDIKLPINPEVLGLTK